MLSDLYHIFYYVPSAYTEKTKKALFENGAGSYGGYTRCCWETNGKGQFLPGLNSSPFEGKKGELFRTDEVKIEMICSKKFIKKAIKALLRVHPYEQVAYGVIKLKL